MRNSERLSIPQWTLGDRLGKARRHAQITREDLATKLGVTRGAVGNWERGERKAPLAAVAQWAEMCGVPLEWLIAGDEARP